MCGLIVAGLLRDVRGRMREPLTVSVKCDPDLAERLRASYEAIVPGYHLNKRHWITITVNGDLADAHVRDLVEDSCALVRPRRGRSTTGPGPV